MGKYDIRIVDNQRGQELHDKLGSRVIYYEIKVGGMTVNGFSDCRARIPFARPLVYVHIDDAQHVLTHITEE